MWDVVFSYSRAEAIEEGVLIDVTETAQEAGFKFPVAVTDTLWNAYIVPSGEVLTRNYGQSTEGRLWDTLYMAALAARQTTGNILFYKVIYLMADFKEKEIQIKSIIGPGDNGEPVITLMLPNED